MTNNELDLAFEFVENTSRNLFLTGKAGTGKTTFLRHLRDHTKKRLIIAAPTGVAAINAGGVTIHSFFQIPFGPIIPNENVTKLLNHKLRSNKINIIKSLDLLIIDEISMVRADLLDAIDVILRRYRVRMRPFGGLQVILIGDILQLAPVTKQDEWNLISPFYNTPYFFSAKVYNEADFINIELKKIYRQENEEFVDILEKIRNNGVDDKILARLNQRFSPDFSTDMNEGYITLTTHNDRAEKINQHKLEKINSAYRIYNAKIKDVFPDFSYPAPLELKLKVGAQVMFIKNDSSTEKRYYNGKLGVVRELKPDSVTVISDDDKEPINVSVETWENVQYSIDNESKNLIEESLGTFTQIPLKLAWAITIHKSQGLTFDKVIIDAQAAFTHGQTYVALSRCRTLEGIVLKSIIGKSAIINDHKVLNFTLNVRENIPDEIVLNKSKGEFQIQLIQDIFNFKLVIYPITNLNTIFDTNQKIIRGNFYDTLLQIKYYIENELNPVIDRFINFIENNSSDTLPMKNQTIIAKSIKALQFFNTKLEEEIQSRVDNFSYSTDNKQLKKDIEKHLKIIEDFIEQKRFCFKGMMPNFDLNKYIELRALATLQKEAIKPKIKHVNDDLLVVEHKELFKKLRDLRTSLSQKEHIELYNVFPQISLYEMCTKLPGTILELRKIKGIGKQRVTKYGNNILSLINEYCEENNIVREEDLIQPKKKNINVGETFRITLEMFRSGLKLPEIAQKRTLALSTIESHLAKFILTRELSIFDVISKDRIEKFETLTEGLPMENVSELKSKTGNEYSYGELRMIVNYKKPQED